MYALPARSYQNKSPNSQRRTWLSPGGPVGPPAWWAVTSNVEVGQTSYPVNRGRYRRKGREGSEGQSHKEEERKGGSRMGDGDQGPLATEGGLYLDIYAGPPSF